MIARALLLALAVLAAPAASSSTNLPIAFSADGKYLACDEPLTVWEAKTGKLVAQIKDKPTKPSACIFWGSDILSFSEADGSLTRFYNPPPASGPKAAPFIDKAKLGDREITAIRLSSDLRTLVTGNFDGKAVVWGLDVGKKLATLDVGPDYVSNLTFTPDGKGLVTCSPKDGIKVWDLATFKEIASSKPGYAVEYSPDGKLVAVLGGEVNGPSLLPLRETLDGPAVAKLVAMANLAKFTPDGKKLIVAGGKAGSGWVKVFEVPKEEPSSTLIGQAGYIASLAISPDGTLVAASERIAMDNTAVHVFDLATGKELYKVQPRAKPAAPKPPPKK